MAKKSNLAVVQDQPEEININSIVEVQQEEPEQPKGKHPGGRPKKYNKQQIAELVQKFAAYIEETEMPIIAEFSYQNSIGKDVMYDYEEFSELTKKAIAKKEAYLEKAGLHNKVNNAMAIFSLKQLGWRDREPEAKGDTVINVTLPNSVKKYAK